MILWFKKKKEWNKKVVHNRELMLQINILFLFYYNNF